jgi:plasmid stabilization system protein ParE
VAQNFQLRLNGEPSAGYIVLENPEAARLVAIRVLASTDRVAAFPWNGRRIPAFPSLPQRELVVPPCRVIYRVEGRKAWILFVLRSERILRRSALA